MRTEQRAEWLRKKEEKKTKLSSIVTKHMKKLREGKKQYPNYLKNQRLRRTNPKVRQIKNGTVVENV